MEPANPSAQPESGDAASSEWRAVLRDAIKLWGPRRAVYNIVLILVALIWLGWTWPPVRAALSLQSLYALSILAIIASPCDSAA